MADHSVLRMPGVMCMLVKRSQAGAWEREVKAGAWEREVKAGAWEREVKAGAWEREVKRPTTTKKVNTDFLKIRIIYSL